jgi:hypothetical protein
LHSVPNIVTKMIRSWRVKFLGVVEMGSSWNIFGNVVGRRHLGQRGLCLRILLKLILKQHGVRRCTCIWLIGAKTMTNGGFLWTWQRPIAVCPILITSNYIYLITENTSFLQRGEDMIQDKQYPWSTSPVLKRDFNY